MSTVKPGPFQRPEPEDKSSNEWEAWSWERKMWTRGLHNESDYNYLKSRIQWHGLDVVLGIPKLPFDDDVGHDDFIYNWRWSNHPMWTDPAYNLIQIYTEHGPSWLEFIASDFRSPEDHHHHISLCNAWELKEWYNHLWDTKGADHANAMAVQWFTKYKVIRARYHGRRARLKGRLTGGLTYALDADTGVEDLTPPYVLWDGFSGTGEEVQNDCDPDVLFVHTLPGNNFAARIKSGEPSSWFKSTQHMHVSLLLD